MKDMILKRNEGAEGGLIGEVERTGESMLRFDLSSSTFRLVSL